MDFAQSEDQKSVVSLAADIFADHCSDEKLQTFARSAAPLDSDLWRVVGEAGLAGIGIAEAAGGNGFGVLETVLLLEQAGRFLAPAPLRQTIGAAQTLAHAGPAMADIVAKAAAGSVILASACEETGGAWQTPSPTAQRHSNGWMLDGVRTAVEYGSEADFLLVSATIEGEGPALFLVPADHDGVTRAAQQGTDPVPLSLVTLNEVALDADAMIDDGTGPAETLRRHLGRMRVLLCASQLGIVSQALERTARYTSERVQFGRPIGSMQAVQQRCADAFMDVEAIRSTLWRAAWLMDQGVFDEAEIAAAKYWAAHGGHRVTHTAQHLHGGMGADVTYPIHRFFLAAHAVALGLGGAQPMLAQLGSLIAAGDARRLSAIGDGRDEV
ncbi:acyl-CoA dehydrogenase family protein [Croceicoccus sp. F390]|uniref:Acyl-CoA dehydrogenase family protein n=1 Tax=Croceicoccus esteveae TaxID=3075597 RepID=A0ABU2ZGP2_9SPHN|nr:acyl-CoA dehydrogenase family protein [Croceicoccus sp. F390]MDT0575376.1 acyl-CoA dehydrogenase family protein [Croceicoccus sp. F390]